MSLWQLLRHKHDPVRHVRRPESDLFTVLDAQRHKPLGDKIDLFAEFIPGKAKIPVGVDYRVILTAARDRLVKKLTQSIFPRDRQVMPCYAR